MRKFKIMKKVKILLFLGIIVASVAGLLLTIYGFNHIDSMIADIVQYLRDKHPEIMDEATIWHNYPFEICLKDIGVWVGLYKFFAEAVLVFIIIITIVYAGFSYKKKCEQGKINT